MQIYCDECKYEFELTDECINSKKIKGITIQYFECAACKEKYITRCFNSYINKEVRRLEKIKQELEDAENEIDKAITRVKYQSCLANLQTHNTRLKIELIKELGEGWR